VAPNNIFTRTSKNPAVLHIVYRCKKGGNRIVSKREIEVRCVFADEADTACEIIIRSLCFYLQRELERDAGGPVFPVISDE
jgi:hypothetical protein